MQVPRPPRLPRRGRMQRASPSSLPQQVRPGTRRHTRRPPHSRPRDLRLRHLGAPNRRMS